jgi:hypothetical protein
VPRAVPVLFVGRQLAAFCLRTIRLLGFRSAEWASVVRARVGWLQGKCEMVLGSLRALAGGQWHPCAQRKKFGATACVSASRGVFLIWGTRKKVAGSSSTIAAGSGVRGSAPGGSSSRYFFGALPQPEEPGCYAGAHPIRQIDRQAHKFASLVRSTESRAESRQLRSSRKLPGAGRGPRRNHFAHR